MRVNKEHDKAIKQAILDEDLEAIKTILQGFGHAKVLQDYYVAVITTAYDQGTPEFFRSILGYIQEKNPDGFQQVFSKRLFSEVPATDIFIYDRDIHTEYPLPLWVLFTGKVGDESRRIVEPPDDFNLKLSDMLQCLMLAGTDKQDVLIKMLLKRIYENMNACFRNYSPNNPEATANYLIYLTHIFNVIAETITIEKFKNLYTEVARQRERFLLAAIHKYNLTILHLFDFDQLPSERAISSKIIQYCVDELNPDITRYFADLSQGPGPNGTLAPPNLVKYFIRKNEYILAYTYAKIINHTNCPLKVSQLKSLLESEDIDTLSKLDSQFQIDWGSLIKQLNYLYPPFHANVVMYFYVKQQRNVVSWLANKIETNEYSRMLNEKDLRGQSAWDIHQQDPVFWDEKLSNNNDDDVVVGYPQMLLADQSKTEMASFSNSSATPTPNNNDIETPQCEQDRSIQNMKELLRQQDSRITDLLSQQKDSQEKMAVHEKEIAQMVDLLSKLTGALSQQTKELLAPFVKGTQAMRTEMQALTQKNQELSEQCAQQLRMIQALMPAVPLQDEDEKKEIGTDKTGDKIKSSLYKGAVFGA